MKQRYRWKKYLSILCVMALLIPMFSGVQVHAEELQEETWQEQATELTEEDKENISDTEAAENPSDTEVTEDTAESASNAEIDEEISSADTETTEEDVEDTVMGTENEEFPDEKQDVEKSDEDARDMGTVSENEVVSDIPDTLSGNDTSAEDMPQTVSDSKQERTGMESYIDEQGNVFTYQTDEDGNAVIIGITLFGDVLLIPEVIGEIPVVTVANEGGCVISNPAIRIPELTINCQTIDTKAFSGLTIGTLTIGTDVKELSIRKDGDSSSKFYYGQFMKCSIEKVVFAATDLSTGYATDDSYSEVFGPFYQAAIGELEIDAAVTRIPEKLFCDSVMELDTLELRTESVGAYAFSGTDINIHHLIIGEEVKMLEEYSDSTTMDVYWEQFSYSTIGTFTYLAEDMAVERVTEAKIYTDQYGPFFRSNIGNLEIGDSVTRIPELFLHNANIQIEELDLTQEYIGAYAFSGSDIEIGTLVLNTTIKELGTWSYSNELFQYWEQFSYSTIGTFVFLAEDMGLERVSEGRSYTEQHPPFFYSNIGELEIGSDVTRIPELFINKANIRIEELDLTQEYIGAYAFSGSDIEIGTLTLNSTVKEFGEWYCSNGSYQHWEQFSNTVIGSIRLYAPALELLKTVGTNEISVSVYGPFQKATVGILELGDQVEVIPDYFLSQADMSMEELEIHVPMIGAEAFSSSNLSFGILTIGEDVTAFQESCFSAGDDHYWNQFKNCTIGTLVYLPAAATTGKEVTYGVFHNASIGNLIIGDGVEEIPNYLFYNAKMQLEELSLNVPVIGCYSFSGKNIGFGKLTIGKSVALFPANSLNYNSAFAYATIGQLDYYATEAQMETLSTYVYGPFSYSTINGLVIGNHVKEIPYGCFRDADMDVEELTIKNADIGYTAFYGSGIHIGTLNIGKNVDYKGMVSNQLKTFYNASIGTLNYNGSAVEPEWTTSVSGGGMFEYCEIGQLFIGEAVEIIPAHWFRNAEMELESLTLSCGWSYKSFSSIYMSIGTLILNADTAEIHHIGNDNMGFYMTEIETVRYEIPSAEFTAVKINAKGPFYNADITNFIVGEYVEYLDSRLLDYCQITNCYVYPVKASESFLNQELTSGYLPKCTHLHIHYNSDFKEYFSRSVEEYHWLCVDYFDTAYGNKWLDEETGAYLVEVFKTCRICGYEETEEKELDTSYDIYLSIPVEIPLVFDAGQKAYVGSESVCAYGTLGDAYEGICLLLETDSESYGKAVMRENIYDISSFMAVGFSDGDAAVFTSKQLTENAVLVENGQTEGLYQEEMTVSVDAAAFLEGGAGEYRISIPMKLEFQY